MSLWEIIQAGGIAMYVIIACSVLAIAVAIERAVAVSSFGARARGLADTVNRCVSRGAIAEARTACERSKSPLADVLLVGFERHGRSSKEAVDGAVDRERIRITLDLKTRLWILGTIGATAPFVGLGGTVIGIMRAFHNIAQQGTGGFTVVSAGISEALVTTAAGIIVALEAVVIYNFFNQHLARVATEMKLMVDEFLETLHEKPMGAGTSTPAPTSTAGGSDKAEKAEDGARQAS
jgi:biopolymer transport protein ExbB